MLLRRCQFRRKKRKMLIYVCVASTVCLLMWMSYNYIINDDPAVILSNSFQSCPLPDFEELSSYSNISFVSQTMKCSNGYRFVTVSKGVVSIKGLSTCTYQCIEWFNDFYGELKEPADLINGSQIPCPFFVSKCRNIDSKKQYRDVTIAVDRNSKWLKRTNCKAAFGNLYDIIIIGVGSLSYNAWKHMLPETFHSFHNELNGVSFTKFNTVGDGATANLQALLTGTKESEVYESRKRILESNFVDEYNWIWSHLKSKGYITTFIDEWTPFGAFQHRLKGFKSQPTDYYLRTAILVAEQLKLIKGICLPSRPLHFDIFEFLNELDEIYSQVPKFSMIHLSRFSRNDSLRYIDRDLSNFISKARTKNPNLLLILFSDDGKFMERKHSMIDKYEERLPFMGISLPNRMEDKRAILERNSKILTSTFDVHATLEDILGIYRPVMDGRHMSLLRPLPDNRSCKDIDVRSHWCSCFHWLNIKNPSSNETIIHLALQVLDIISSKTKQMRYLCEDLLLDNIVDAYTLLPSTEVLRFKKSADPDGFSADMSDNTQQDIFWYKMIVMVKPSGVRFDVSFTAKFQISIDKPGFSVLKLHSKDIRRLTNKHKLVNCFQKLLKGSEAELRTMEKYCICKNKNNYF